MLLHRLEEIGKIVELLLAPIRQREAYINKLATTRGVAQPAVGEYTVEQWKKMFGASTS